MILVNRRCHVDVAAIAQDHGVLGRPQPRAPDFHDRRSKSDAWRPLLTVIMDVPAVQRLAFHDRGQMVSLCRSD
jgi:hypothetical protein